MHLMTKYFGQIDYDPTEVLSFPNGIFGFEEEKQFLLLPFHGGGGNLLCRRKNVISSVWLGPSR